MTQMSFGRSFLFFVGTFLATLGGLTGCASLSPSTPQLSTTAGVNVINRTDYSWRLRFSAAGQETIESTVPPRQTSTVSLPAGEYRIQQAVVGTTDTDHLTRSLTSTFKPGKTYRWPLVTLLSEASEAPP